MCYDAFSTGMSWTEIRRLIITIGVDGKTGKTKYGRRNGVLGYWHELKMMFWDQHVGECTDAREKVEALGQVFPPWKPEKRKRKRGPRRRSQAVEHRA
jgi:hypothetical protein